MLLRHASAPNRWRPQSDVLQKTSSFLFCLASLTFGGAVYIGADDHSSVIDVVLAVLLETLFRAGHTSVSCSSVGRWLVPKSRKFSLVRTLWRGTGNPILCGARIYLALESDSTVCHIHNENNIMMYSSTRSIICYFPSV